LTFEAWTRGHLIVAVCVLQIKLMVSSDVATVSTPGYKQRPQVLSAISTCVVLLVASIPIAIELVSTTTMAMGSRRLAERKVIVSRLSAIEELAGMTILCSDKTGTLTQNKLSLNEPILFHEGISGDDLVFYAALCSKRGGGQDAIDFCMTQSLTPNNK
jgi:H+-transporting ATPase